TAVEYDPNRSARIALLTYADGEKRYILAPVGISVGARVACGPEADIQPGNGLPLKDIPVGTTVHHIALHPARRGEIVRRAGMSGAGGNPQTPWGKPALGYRTRRNKKTRNMIVRRRPPKRKSKS